MHKKNIMKFLMTMSLTVSSAFAATMNVPSTLKVSAMDIKTVGILMPDDIWNLNKNGEVANGYNLVANQKYNFDINAYATSSGGKFPYVKVLINDVIVSKFNVFAAPLSLHRVVYTPKVSGVAVIRILYTNDANTSTEDRNLYLESLTASADGVVVNPTPTTAQSYYDLEIIQPRAGLDTKNRFYKAYPGLPYEVRAAVIGGAYPFKYALKTAPSGMSIDVKTGVISWASPTESTTPYNVTLSVSDQKNAVKDVSWTVLVTKNKFMFVDAVNGRAGATGTITDPVKSFLDVYGGSTYNDKYSTKNQDYFVYFKDGTYIPQGFRGGSQMVQLTTRQPVVWMAYPNHKPVISMRQASFEAKDNPHYNFYVEGFDIDTIETDAATEQRMGFRISSTSTDVVFRHNKFHSMSMTTGSYNQSAIMINKGGQGKYWAFQDNEFYDIHKGYGILGYVAQKVLIEDNYFHDMDSGHPIGPKTSTSYWFIRHNKITDAKDYGIWLYGNDAGFNNMEISFNYVNMISGAALSINEAYVSSLDKIYVFRNTFVGDVVYHNLNDASAVYVANNNVLINNFTNGFQAQGSNQSLFGFVKDNLVGRFTSTIVDDDGKLTEDYRNYVGLKGWETP